MLPLLGHARGLSAGVIGGILGAFALAAALIRLVTPAMAARVKEWVLLSFALGLAAVLLALYPLMSSVVAMAVCSILIGAAVGSVQPLVMGLLHQITPPDAMVAKLPLLEGSTDVATFMSWGFNPFLSEKSPFHGAVYAVTESVCKAVAAGARLSDVRLTLQEYFPKLGNDPKRWGLPFAALIGAFHAQHSLRLAAIGGKDSMSGSFNDLDVPPTLVSFALAPGKASLALSPEFKQAGSTVSLVEVPLDADQLPDFEKLKSLAEQLHQLNVEGKFLALHHIGHAGLAAAISKMSFGNHLGAEITTAQDLFAERYFAFVIEHSDPLPSSLNAQTLGHTTAEPSLILNGKSHALTDLLTAWTGTLEPVYPTKPETQNLGDLGDLVVKPYSSTDHRSPITRHFRTSSLPLPLFPSSPLPLFPSMFDVRCSMFDVRCSMFDVRSLLAIPGEVGLKVRGGSEQVPEGILPDRVHQAREQREALVLVFDQRVLLSLGAKVNAFPKFIHVGEVLPPVPVDGDEHHAALLLIENLLRQARHGVVVGLSHPCGQHGC
jgi:hypothetical protein